MRYDKFLFVDTEANKLCWGNIEELGTRACLWVFEDAYILEDGWLKMYLNPQNKIAFNETVITDEMLNQASEYHKNSKDYDGFDYSFDNRNYWYTNELYNKVNNIYTRSDGTTVTTYINHIGYKKIVMDSGVEPTVIPGAHGEYVNENGYYWIGVGPKVLYKDYPDDGEPGNDGNNYLVYDQGTIDIVVEKNNIKYYIRGVVGDIKAHTWTNGIFQTWRVYPSGELSSVGGNYHGVVVCEFIIDNSIIGNLNDSNYAKGYHSLGDYAIDRTIFYKK